MRIDSESKLMIHFFLLLTTFNPLHLPSILAWCKGLAIPEVSGSCPRFSVKLRKIIIILEKCGCMKTCLECSSQCYPAQLAFGM